MVQDLSTGAPRRALRNTVLLEHAAVLVVLAAVALALEQSLPLGRLFAEKALAAASIGGMLTAWLAIRYLPSAAFGAANRVTLVRGALLALLIACIGEPASAWLVVVAAGAGLALDGVDGWLARRSGTASRFGARFDMETDALSLLVLTVLVWQLGKAGVWILAAGLLRYGFVALGYVVPRLGRPLPERLRRKSAFVVAFVLLIVAAAPIVARPAGQGLALAALLLLALSFAVDTRYLARGGDGSRA